MSIQGFLFPRSASSRILNLLQLTNTGLEITATNDAFGDKNAFLRYFASISTGFFSKRENREKRLNLFYIWCGMLSHSESVRVCSSVALSVPKLSRTQSPCSSMLPAVPAAKT